MNRRFRKWRRRAGEMLPTPGNPIQRPRTWSLRIDRIPSNHTRDVVVQNMEAIMESLSSPVEEFKCRSLAARDQNYNCATATFCTTTDADGLASQLTRAASSYGYRFSNDFDGITPLFDGICSSNAKCSEIECGPTVDIVAVPGLSCHALGSWMSSNKDVAWLRDFLPVDVPHCRILLYGYDSNLSESMTYQSMADLGSDFWETLSTFRNNNRSTHRPTIFIGHSLGGLVIKEALVHSQEGKDDSTLNLSHTCAGLLFFGVPNLGLRNEALKTMVHGQANEAIMRDLVVTKESEPSNYMKKLNQQFSHMCKGSFPIIAFFERKASPTLAVDSNGQWARIGTPRMLVTEESASSTGLAGQTEKIACNNSDHRDLVKFDNDGDRVYAISRDRIRRMMTTPTPKSKTQVGFASISVSQTEVEACLKSLAFPNMYSRENDIERATHGTCGWLLEHEAWLQWQQKSRGLLWIQGKPGSGKSTLLSYALRQLEAQNSADTFIVSFFIHGRGEQLQKTQIGLYRSIVHQVLRQQPKAFKKLIDSFNKHSKEVENDKRSWTWTIPLLQEYLYRALIEITKNYRVVIFLDALDEAGRDSAIEIIDFFGSFTKAPLGKEKPLHICYSCRNHPELKWDNGLEIQLDRENRADIDTFCQGKLSRRLYRDMGESLVNRSEGVFIWVRLVVRRAVHLDAQGDSAKMIRMEVEKMPQELEELYHTIIQRDLGPDSDLQFRIESLRLFQWIVFSGRPLNRHEIPWALAMGTCNESFDSIASVRDAPAFIALDRVNRKIKSLSCGLIEFTFDDAASDTGSMGYLCRDTESDTSSDKDSKVESDSERNSERGSETGGNSKVQFIHQTAKDYFLDRGLLDLEVSIHKYSIDKQAGLRAHLQLSQDCLRYIRLVALAEGEPVADHRNEPYAFLEYVTWQWSKHYRVAELVDSHAEFVLNLFMHPPQLFFRSWSLGLPNWESVTNVYQFSCFHGLVNLLNHTLNNCENPDVWLNVPNRMGKGPLGIAVSKHHGVAVQKLIETGKVDLELRDLYGKTPLSEAVGLKDVEIEDQISIKLLLEAGADIEAKDYCGRTPLSIAAERGHELVIMRLLEAGAYIETKDHIGRTPLAVAASFGYHSIVDLLLKAGADIET